MGRLNKQLNQEVDHIHGNQDAQITVIEYGDFQSPECQAAYPIFQQLFDHFGSRVRFCFRHFPRTQNHEQAQLAAEAAEAAGAQGKFWDMHDLLFEHSDGLDLDHLCKHAEALGMDPERFREDLENHVYESKVREDFLSGVRSGVNDPPAVFINCNLYEGAMDRDALIQAIEQALGEMQIPTTGGDGKTH